MSDQTEIDWHREQIAKNRLLIEEVEAGNTAGSDVFPETQAEIDRLKAQMAQSELIVAAYDKEPRKVDRLAEPDADVTAWIGIIRVYC